MAAASLHKLLKKQPPLRILSTFKTPISPNPLLQQNTLKPQPSDPSIVNPLLGSANTEVFYPSYPFGYFFNSISVNALEEEGTEEDDGQKIWADSVKKKRKRKMNKHKLRKLRKRLRKKT